MSRPPSGRRAKTIREIRLTRIAERSETRTSRAAAPLTHPKVAAYGRCIDKSARIEQIRAELDYLRQKRDLYRAKSYGPRTTSPERMRELDRAVAQAEERLANARHG